MTEKYTYGYNNGWNVENEYINSLIELMNDYNEQVAKLEEINETIENSNKSIEENNAKSDVTVTEKQMRACYNEDYLLSGSLRSFEAYKRDMLEYLKKSNESNREKLNNETEALKSEILRMQNEYVANQYYLIDLKNETRKSILKRKNDINLLLSEKRIQLSSILLEQQRVKPQYDDSGKILNSKELISLRNKYDSVWLEIRKLEHVLQRLDEMFALVEFTKEETDLMMRGLNSNQKEIYNNIIDTQMKVDSKVEIINIEETKNDTLESVGPENIEPVETAQTTESKLIEEDIEDLSNNEEEVIEVNEETNKVHDEVENKLSFEEIIKKVCGDSSFTKKQSSRYAASKIKVFNKPQINSQGLLGKITSIGKSIIGIIPKAAMKLYGKLIDTETEEMFQDMEARAMELTDDEVETLLNEYNGNLNLIPEGFEEIIKPRVNLYISKAVDSLQKIFSNAMYQIASSQIIIEQFEDERSVEDAYVVGCFNIKSLIKIQIMIEKLLKVSKLHSFESQLKSLDNKLVYAGGRFEKAKEYDTSLWSKVSGLSQKIEYSLDPKEVVDSYTEREKIYKEHGKHKSYLTEEDLEKLNNISKKEEKVEKVDSNFKTSEEIRSLIEGLKTMKAELTEQDVKEIEGLLR